MERILEGHLSVRQAEGLKRAAKAEAPTLREAKADTLRDLELNLSRVVGTKVRVSGDRKGKIELHFGSRDELERLLELLNYSA